MTARFIAQQQCNSRYESFRSVTERFTLDAVLSSRERRRYGTERIPEQFECWLVASSYHDGIMELNGNSDRHRLWGRARLGHAERARASTCWPMRRQAVCGLPDERDPKADVCCRAAGFVGVTSVRRGGGKE